MLDTKKVGIKIASFRKKNGLSQEKLGEMLCISPQAISKWENGHTLPETSLLPVLSQIFNCKIDEIIMPAYSFDSKIEENKPNMLEQQAQNIAKYVVAQLGGNKMLEEMVGLDDNEIFAALKKTNPNIGNCEVSRRKHEKRDRFTCLYITVTSPQKEIKLIEKIYNSDDKELYGYSLINQNITAIPQIYYLDNKKRIILMEDCSNYIQGFHFDEDSDDGKIFRKNYNTLLNETAKLHTAFWQNTNVFGKIGLDWRHETKENLLTHINGMEKDFLIYKQNEESGKIPKVWGEFTNTIDTSKLNYFKDTITSLKQEYINVLDTRFHAGKNITIIHGDLHPGNTFLSKSNKKIKFIDMEAIRIGLCTEDLAMLLALHIEPDKKYVMPLIDYYYSCLCENINGYSYEAFINDYKLSIIENMFYTIRLINNGIYDFTMRDKALKAYETFVLDKK